MIGALLELDFEYRRRLQRGGQCLVGQLLVGSEVHRVEDLRLVVVGEALRDPLEGVGERLPALPVRAFLEAIVVLRDSFNEKTLALRPGADGAPARNRFSRLAGAFGGRTGGIGIADHIGGNAPGRDRALRVALEHLAEGLLAFAEPERVQQRDPAPESRLHRRIAGIRKGHLAELLGRLAMVMCLAPRRGRDNDRKGDQRRCEAEMRRHQPIRP